ncbi:hypothetical protein BAUCODRAFT_135691 [Baudoinia panamericana UAMH 10762]|uniref:Uncharacterized protein n=1 Tax=Baudoinia panamericana (strain UAMH 10762) TaxID=717646 RepID=M2N9Q8_BAUPA|nr:uncharacterized protein BAUCODRAFT_135691 [Baudoinia panamericana UAMH 10762]EMD00934.1 hypothetical protein BAUCODRAFT_135691 [Baudoinia panamericana UAMH 10762]
MTPGQCYSQASLLTLPAELRQQIYGYLIAHENVSHPLPSVGITAVTHRLPSTRILHIHPTLTEEILDYYYSISTWKLIFSHAFNFFRVDPELRKLELSPVLRRLRKVEVVFFCDILLLKEYPSFGIGSFCAEIRRRADRACDVLSRADDLRVVTVSWIDTTLTGGWSEKATILEPLRKLALKRDIMFRIGEINGPDDVDRALFLKAMQEVLGENRQLDAGFTGAADEPNRLRMLAFDPRQERPSLHQQGKISPRPRLSRPATYIFPQADSHDVIPMSLYTRSKFSHQVDLYGGVSS